MATPFARPDQIPPHPRPQHHRDTMVDLHSWTPAQFVHLSVLEQSRRAIAFLPTSLPEIRSAPLILPFTVLNAIPEQLSKFKVITRQRIRMIVLIRWPRSHNSPSLCAQTDCCPLAVSWRMKMMCRRSLLLSTGRKFGGTR